LNSVSACPSRRFFLGPTAGPCHVPAASLTYPATPVDRMSKYSSVCPGTRFSTKKDNGHCRGP
jgi:hypothetical protein